MKAIRDNKVYDTEKAEEVMTFYRETPVTGINLFGQEIKHNVSRECILYKTVKGNWFEHRKKMNTTMNSKDIIVLVNEEDVKSTFRSLGEVEKYEEYFEKLEEA